MKKQFHEFDQFDGIVVGLLVAEPQHDIDFDFYRSRSIDQIECSISNISSARKYPELIASVAQANAFIDSAYNLELINLSEKVEWVNKVHAAHKNQLVEA